MFTRLYLSHLEADGRFSKPFLLPQQDPAFYSRCLMTFNRPELLREPVTVTASELTRAMGAALAPAAAGAPNAADAPWQPVR